MARFSPQVLDDIRNRLTLSDIVGRRVSYDRRKSQPQKGDFWGCCPFHNEKTPSFHVDDRKGIYHCFGCGATGDHFRFLTEKEGLSFPEAVERLADEAGVILPKLDPQMIHEEKRRASLYDVLAMAQQFFVEQLQGSEAAAARGYLKSRGLTLETQRRFGIGFAPRERSALKQYLAAKGVDHDQMAEAGLIVSGPDIPVSYDKFRDRIMFPILDLRERVIAFGGRAMAPDNPAKYMNSPETPLFSKRTVLYNAAHARKAAHERGRIIVVEGYMDVIALAQAGIEEAVAPLGTALTGEQLQLLWKNADEPILCFDGDEAGLRAANRSVDTALPMLAPGKSICFAFLPKGKDPDDLIRESGVEEFEDILKEKLPLYKMVSIRHFDGGVFDTPEKKVGLEKRIFSDIALIRDQGIAYHYRQSARIDLANFFSVKDNRFQGKKFQENLSEAKIFIGSNTLSRVVLGFIAEFPWMVSLFDSELTRIELGNQAFIEFIAAVRRLVIDDDVHTISELYDSLPMGFHTILHAVHGIPERAVREGDDVSRYARERGYKLRMLFPGLRLDPSEDLLRQTMDLHMRKLFLMSHKKDIEEAWKSGDGMRASALAIEYHRSEAEIRELEEYVTEQYDDLRKLVDTQTAA